MTVATVDLAPPLRFALPTRAAHALRVAVPLPTTMHFAVAALAALSGGILLSILTTIDPLWWRLHFSRLGTFHDGSGALFNGSLIAAGAIVVLYACSVRRDLRRVETVSVRRGAALTAQICLSTIGVNLALVGCIPLNVNKPLHDNVAAGMVLGFAALLLSSPVLMHRMPRRLVLTTAAIFVLLFAGAWLFVTATINLALFEVIAFGAMFTWSGVFTRCLTQRVGELSATPDAPVAIAAESEPPSPRPAPVRRPLRRPSVARPALRPARRLARRNSPPARRDGRRDGRRGVRVLRPRGYRGWAARSASARSTTPDRR